jgi:hypothetical protein
MSQLDVEPLPPSLGEERRQEYRRSANRGLIALLSFIIVASSFVLGFFLAEFSHTVPTVNLNNSRSVNSCTQDTIKLIKLSTPEIGVISQIIDVCSVEIDSQERLNDFELRRLAFLSRYYADRITLWMVVIITLSGVLLAGLQLGASYRLALLRGTELGSNNVLTVEQGKLIFRSSITGLVVLLISLAFFLIYVRYIYVMPEVNVDGSHQKGTQLVVPTLSPGGLGAAPTADPPPAEPAGSTTPTVNTHQSPGSPAKVPKSVHGHGGA